MYAFRCSRARLFGANGSYETVRGPEGNDGRPQDIGTRFHGARSTSGLELDELTPSFSTDIITCTRTVLTTDDPPLVTFFQSRGINACLPSLLSALLRYLLPRCSFVRAVSRASHQLTASFLSHSFTRRLRDLADASQQQQNTRTTSASRNHRHWQSCHRCSLDFPAIFTARCPVDPALRHQMAIFTTSARGHCFTCEGIL